MMASFNSSRPAPRRGFTLIEVLIVVGIILILAAIGVAVGLGVKRGANERRTHATFRVLEGAMATFLKDNPEPTNARNWVAALMSYTPSGDLIKREKLVNLAPLPPPTLPADFAVLDGYGNPILYIPSRATQAWNPPYAPWNSPPPPPTPAPPAPATGPSTWSAKPTGFFWSFGADGMPAGVLLPDGKRSPDDDMFSDAVGTP